MTAPAARNVLREPAPDVRDSSRIGQYLRWLEQSRGLVFDDYRALHRWSVDDLEGFWSSVWECADVRAATPPTAVLTEATMPGAKWFPGATLNYAEHATRPSGVDPAAPAIIGVSQTRDRVQVTWTELADQVGRARHGLRRLGGSSSAEVECGDSRARSPQHRWSGPQRPAVPSPCCGRVRCDECGGMFGGVAGDRGVDAGVGVAAEGAGDVAEAVLDDLTPPAASMRDTTPRRRSSRT
jgi:hypothetical protein